MDYKKVNAGDALTIPANVWNGLMDVLAEVRGNSSRGRTPLNRAQQLNAGVIMVKNNTGAVLDRFSVVGIGSPIVTPSQNEPEFQRRVVVNAAGPSDTYKGAWAIVQVSIPIGGWGLAVADGVTVTKVNISNAAHKRCEVQTGSTSLVSKANDAGSGIILWSAGGTGLQWCVVRVGNSAPESSLPEPTGLYQVVIVTSYTASPKAWTWGADWPRAHN